MRHRNSKAILNRPADQRKALLRNLLEGLFLHHKVETTDAKAKALASAAEKLISKVKSKDNMNAIRELKKVLFTEAASRKALEYIQATQKQSGFTRKTKTRMRAGDNALMMQVELISLSEKE